MCRRCRAVNRVSYADAPSSCASPAAKNTISAASSRALSVPCPKCTRARRIVAAQRSIAAPTVAEALWDNRGMTNKSKTLPYVFLSLAVAVGCGAALVARHHLREQPNLAAGTLIEPRAALPAFKLLDHHGRPFTVSNLTGHWSMLYFGYTNCPDLCPATLGTLAAMEKRLRAASAAPRPQVVFVSADAVRDTPAQLAAYVPYFDPEFVGVTARDQPAAEAFATALGIAIAINHQPDGSYTVDHSSAILIIDPQARVAAILTGPFTVDELQADFHAVSAASS